MLKATALALFAAFLGARGAAAHGWGQKRRLVQLKPGADRLPGSSVASHELKRQGVTT